ncbi:TrmH family RNA methyltransferase [Algoriphagus namhaensis]
MTETEKIAILNSKAFQTGFKEYLKVYVTAHKQQKIREVLGQRTRHFTLVLEDIYKPHNASAVIRTCDCFGVQDIHVIEKTQEYKINPYVTRGSAQWVDLYKYHQPEGSAVQLCFDSLRKNGYKIVGTSPKKESKPIQELPFDSKMALVFGNEHEGISEEVIENCDELMHIPMMGFAESFNISVAAAICLHELTSKALSSPPEGYFLDEEEKDRIEYGWFRDIVKNVEAHEAKFLREFLSSFNPQA